MSFSIYLHVPFCTSLCPHCHFFRVPEVPDWKVYLDSVIGEIDALENLEDRTIATFYAGGGTPTLLPPEFYASLFERLGNRFDMTGLAEGTIETDGALKGGRLAGYAGAGFDRVSIGVKSFDPRIREILGIGPLPPGDPVHLARRAGFMSVGLDLLYGIGGQGMDDLAGDLGQAVNSHPDHISLYILEGPDSGTPPESEPDLAAAMFRESARILGTAGYRQYEITNFARPGEESLHNTVYWEDGDFIGLGPSAHSSLTLDGTRIRWRNRPDIFTYMSDPLLCREELSRDTGPDRAREALILALRLKKGVHRPSFTRRYGSDPLELLTPHQKELWNLGLIRYSAERLRLTTRGMILSNEVFVRILDDNWTSESRIQE